MAVLLARPPLAQQQARDLVYKPIVIGLVNNMPDAALRSTERQFYGLLSAACPNVAIQLKLFSLPGLPRGNEAQAYVNQFYEHIGGLWTDRFDGLIVTGTEPCAPELTQEPYWPTLAELIDWTEKHTVSTIWSCLAAHAAVLRIDGIPRRSLPAKLFGIFDCTRAAEHAITVHTPSHWHVPHSRCNSLSDEILIANGYRILSTSPDVEADIFVKCRNSLFVFLQGHPEYGPGALLREYRRDIARFLAGERESYPEMPRDYFDEGTRAAFAAYRELVSNNPNPDLIASLPAVDKKNFSCDWHGFAVQLYANWFSYLLEQRTRNSAPIGWLRSI
jgi:homoserine O-succinyltransferase